MTTVPFPLRPDSDLSTTGWEGNDGSTSNLYARVADDDVSTYVTTEDLIKPALVVLDVMLDDQKIDDVYETIQPGWPVRAGEKCLKQTLNFLNNRSLQLRNLRCTRGLCEPTRTERMTALNRENHGCENSVADTYNYWVIGTSATKTYDGSTQYQGPYWINLAMRAGLPDTAVAPVDQPYVGTTGGVRSAVAAWNSSTNYTVKNQLVSRSGTNYLCTITSGNQNKPPESNPSYWTATTAVTGRGNTNARIDDLQYTTGGIMTNLPDDMTTKDINAGRPAIYKAWIDKANTYDGATSGPSPYNAPDPLGDVWNSSTTYNSGDSVHDGLYFYTSAQNSNTNHAPTAGASNSFWTLVGPARTTRWVPPGMNFTAILNGDGLGEYGAIYDFYHNEYVYYDSATAAAPNSRDGLGAIGDLLAFDYDWPISSITYSGSQAIITLTSNLGYKRNGNQVDEPIQAGDEICIDGTGTAYDGLVWIADAPQGGDTGNIIRVTADINGNAIGNHGTFSTAGAFVYPLKYYNTQISKRWLNVVLTRIGKTKPAYIKWDPRIPHAEVDDTGGTISGEPEFEQARRYWHSCSESHAYYYGGVAGGVSPANSVVPSSTNQKTWRLRQELLAAFDDTHGWLINQLDGSHGASGWYHQMMSDNGWQQGAHLSTEDSSDVNSRVNGKDFIWDESIHVMGAVSWPGNSRFAPGNNYDYFTPADITMNLLSMFESVDPSLTNHNWHTKKDGYSIDRYLASPPDDQIRNRALLAVGKYLEAVWAGTQSHSLTGGYAIIDQTGQKFIRRFDDTTGAGDGSYGSSWKRFDVSTGAPEINNLVTGSPGSFDSTTAAMAVRLGNVHSGRWDGTTNSYRTA